MMPNIPFDRPIYLLVESLLARRQQIEQAAAKLDSDVEQTCRFLEKMLGLEANAVGSKYLLTVEGLIEQQTEAPSQPGEFEQDEADSASESEQSPDPPSVS